MTEKRIGPYIFGVDADGVDVIHRENLVCDFCLDPWPEWEYPVKPMTILGHPVMTDSADDWAVCDQCHALIEAGEVDRLIMFAVKMQPVNEPDSELIEYPPLGIGLALMERNVLMFMENRNGEPTRLTDAV